jgi:hypothetical protein
MSRALPGNTMDRMRALRAALLLTSALALTACAGVRRRPEIEAPAPVPGTPLPPDPSPEEEELPVKKVQEEIVVAAWAEPARLPPGGGQTQLLVRVQKRGGAPFPGVEVRFRTSSGRLYSGSGVLVTDARGMTRDRLTVSRTTVVTLNAGGTRYRFRVPVSEPPAP